MAQRDGPLTSRAAAGALALLLVGARLAYRSASGDFVWEDALISLRYAENLIHGAGFTYNPGERVFGTTTPLYVLWLAVLEVVTGRYFWTFWKLSSLAFDALTVFAIATTLRKESTWAGAAVFTALMAFDSLLANTSISGMETSAVLMLMGLMIWGLAADRPRLVGALAALLCLTRVDGVIFAAVILLALALRSRTGRWAGASTFAAVLLPGLLLELLYFGSFIPNTIAAKRIAYPYPLDRMLREVSEVYYAHTGPINVLALAGVYFIARTYRYLWFLLAFDALYFAFLVMTRVYAFEWYFAPGLLAHFLVAAVGAQGLIAKIPHPPGRAVVTAALVAGIFLFTRTRARDAAEWQRALQAYESAVRMPIGRWLRAETPESSTVLLEPIGYVGYYSHRYVYDAVGLVSKKTMEVRDRHRNDWLYHMAAEFDPDFIVARKDFEEPVLSLSDEQKADLLRRYAMVLFFPTPDGSLPSMMILKRRGPRASDIPRPVTPTLPAYEAPPSR